MVNCNLSSKGLVVRAESGDWTQAQYNAGIDISSMNQVDPNRVAEVFSRNNFKFNFTYNPGRKDLIGIKTLAWADKEHTPHAEAKIPIGMAFDGPYQREVLGYKLPIWHHEGHMGRRLDLSIGYRLAEEEILQHLQRGRELGDMETGGIEWRLELSEGVGSNSIKTLFEKLGPLFSDFERAFYEFNGILLPQEAVRAQA